MTPLRSFLSLLEDFLPPPTSAVLTPEAGVVESSLDSLESFFSL